MVGRMTQSPSPYRFAFAGMAAMAVAMGIGRFVYTPLLPGMMEELGLSAADAGLIASANFLGYLVGAIVTAGGWAQGRERAILLGALASSAVLALAMGFTDSLPVFMVIRFLAGVASAFVMVFLATIVLDHLAAAGRSDLQAIYFGGVGLGISISAIMTVALVVTGVSWTGGWYWAGGLSMLGLVLVALLLDRGPIVTGAARREPALPKSTSLARIIIAYGIFGFSYVITATFLVAIVRQGGFDRMFESVVWLVTGLAALPSVYLWDRVSARTGMVVAFAIGCAIEAIGIVASVSVGGHIGPLLGGVLLGGTFVAITAFGLRAGLALAPAAPRRVVSIMTASFGVGQIIAPILAGYAAQWTGSFLLPSLVAALALATAGVIGLSIGTAANSP